MQKTGHDRHSYQRELHVGQNVMAKNLRPGAAWVPGVVVERVGPLTYLVQVDDGNATLITCVNGVVHCKRQQSVPHILNQWTWRVFLSQEWRLEPKPWG